jgi:hypothetical protein
MGRGLKALLLIVATIVLSTVVAVSRFSTTDSSDSVKTSAADPSQLSPGTDGPTKSGLLAAPRYEYPMVKVAEFAPLEKLGHVCYGITEPAPVSDTRDVSAPRSSPAVKQRPGLGALPGSVYDCLLTCFPSTSSSWGNDVLQWAKPCVNTEIGAISEIVLPEDLYIAISALTNDYPEVNQTCHESAHVAPKMAVVHHGRRLSDLISTVPVMACGFGFLHGVMDALPYDSPSVEIIVEVSNKCVQLVGGGPHLCAHGMGHAAWDVYENADDALKKGCAAFMKDGFIDCSSAIAMRRWERLGDNADIDKIAADAISFCATSWPVGSLPNGVDLRSGCWGGITPQLWYQFSYGGGIDSMSEPEVREFIGKVTDVCNSFPVSPAPDYPRLGGKVNYCDVLTGRYVAVAAESDLARGRTLCSYSTASVKLCNSELEMYIDVPVDKRGEVTTPL